ncbi:TIGR04197 family type VII secretion effector [Streptococcus agalactiae]|uniref:TIGR04197 family type VII secretion effector n=1 Tax=Streptococcus agalactiae TaxID=1311 RepID=UPI0002BBF8B1|nr:TIGR04197 family type VII secretion effector [Streptococcus agalactiae]EPU21444.1 hypothetical protein SAG0135_03495 [Streptococcus agalactiae LMG 14609]EPU28663.1 hypothetical protein SAG0146_02690 [Streptococcus agalactiae MRI Z1-039]EPU20352.1 hypothetical protein SAG0137_00970 [Streptococcus agalactiae LMG 14838]KAF1108557.1 type VII secretion effector [Streptococcus agalactiae]KAF1126664.1 type VII secretion effector [Streptococcus agalactiae]
MAKIQSDVSLASSVATGISSAGAEVLSVTKATLDETTTLQGNSTAHEKINLDDATGQQIASSIDTFVGLIHSTASAFVSTDQSLSQMLLNGGEAGPTTYKATKPKKKETTLPPAAFNERHTALFGG